MNPKQDGQLTQWHNVETIEQKGFDEYRSRQSIISNGSNTRAGSRINSSNVVTGMVLATMSPTPKLEWKKILKGNGQSCISVYFLYLLLMM